MTETKTPLSLEKVIDFIDFCPRAKREVFSVKETPLFGPPKTKEKISNRRETMEEVKVRMRSWLNENKVEVKNFETLSVHCEDWSGTFASVEDNLRRALHSSIHLVGGGHTVSVIQVIRVWFYR